MLILCFLILTFQNGMLKWKTNGEFTIARVQTSEILNCKSLSTVNLMLKNRTLCLRILLTLNKSQNFVYINASTCNSGLNCKFQQMLA